MVHCDPCLKKRPGQLLNWSLYFHGFYFDLWYLSSLNFSLCFIPSKTKCCSQLNRLQLVNKPAPTSYSAAFHDLQYISTNTVCHYYFPQGGLCLLPLNVNTYMCLFFLIYPLQLILWLSRTVHSKWYLEEGREEDGGGGGDDMLVWQVTRWDSEVILISWDKQGLRLVSLLRGTFSRCSTGIQTAIEIRK